jgi:hypothetical protein
MSKASDVTAAFMSILFGAIVWFVLQVIIGVAAWVSIVAGGAVAVAGVLMAAGVFGARTAKKHHRRHQSGLSAH